MAEAQNEKFSKTHMKKTEEDLPPLPSLLPQDPAPGAPTDTGNQDPHPLPPPPPKESFSKFYQQRQVNELKRLYRHMHPELRKNLEEAVSEDLAEMLSTEDPNALASGSSDAMLPGEVQSMRWVFENWTLDSIGEHQATKKLTEEEAIPGGDVKNRSMKFENQPSNGALKVTEKDQTRGDVHTARWLFETQPLDSLNKMYLDETDLQATVLKEPIQSGDVKGAAHLFETHSLDAVGRCNSVEEKNILQLKSEIQEVKGDVNKTIKLFQTEPLCAIRDQTGNMHEIKSICREEIHSNAVKTARWLFETQPLDTINKDTSKVQVIRGISLEEAAKGNVGGAKWLFETQPLDTIREIAVEEADFKPSPDLIQGADVSKQCLLFETQPLDTLKGETSDDIPAKEEIVKGDVKSTLWLFETQPMESLKDNFEVGHLKKVELSEEEKGAVKETKHVFETCPLGSISKSAPEDASDTTVREVEKGDVKAFKSLFETLPLDSIRQTSIEEAIMEEEVILHGNVKANQLLFETKPLYAIKDCFGNFHEVTSVSREEEVAGGDTKKYKWMFETKPLDQFDDSVQKVDIIKGITKQEVMAGDVETAKWLFETQPIDVIHSQKNQPEQEVPEETSLGGDVKTCRWLFETQPMDALYEKAEQKQESKEPLPHADVKSCTWMFETQPLDSLKGQEEQYLHLRKTYSQDEVQGVDVKTVRHLFQTDPLNTTMPSSSNSNKLIRYSSRVEIQSGEVSRVKEFFEAKPLDSADKSVTTLKASDIQGHEDIEPGSVHKFTWLFENCPMDTLKSSMEGFQEMPPEKDVQGGDVGGKRFIFETYSLDQIHDNEIEVQIKKIQEETMNKVNVKSCTLLFETHPLYAIQDKDGGYHEVTSVKKEEIMKGDVKGARWQFETKPLDQIKKDEEVFVIRAVTQEDMKKGDALMARWRFETEPLDSIAGEKKPILRTVDDVQKGDVQSNKQLFESEQVNQKRYVRMVSVSDVQQGDVRTSTWLFENQPIDSLKGDSENTSDMTTVQREDIHKGDVKRCTWLFESQPMDKLKDSEVSTDVEPADAVPQTNVKSTTWLFESTPLDKLSTSQQCTDIEIKERTIKDTLEVLVSHEVIQHDGILIEANDAQSVKMVKYQLGSQKAPEIQKEEVTGGNLQRILIQLLQRTNVEAQGLFLQEDGSGNIKISEMQLRDNLSQTLQELLSQDASAKKGIVMQETATGSAKMAIYSLQPVSQKCELVKGDVKSVIGNLLASSQEQRASATIRREDNEKGNVQLYTRCIEKGELEYLKNLQRESEIESLVSSQAKEESLKSEQGTNAPVQASEEKAMMTTVDIGPGNISESKRMVLCENKEHQLDRGGMHAADLGFTTHCLVQSSAPITGRDNAVSQNVKQTAQSSSNKVVTEEKIFLGRKSEGATKIVAAQKDLIGDGIQSSPVGKASQMTPQPQTQIPGNDLQAAMENLRMATAEAKSLQHHVQSKLQKTSEDTQLVTPPCQASIMQRAEYKEGCKVTKQQHTSNVAFLQVQETSTAHAKVSQKNTSHTKVSASEEVQGGLLPRAELSIKDGVYTAKPVKSYVNPFIESEYKQHSVPEEREQDEIIGGDVKTAIRALQNAATEQRHVDKEDVVRGDLKATLESLEKSNVNISKGDFKAAMIYRNAGQSYHSCKKKTEAQTLSNQEASLVPSGSPALIDFPPSPASLLKTECSPSSAKTRETEMPQHSPSTKPQISKIQPSSALTHPSHQKPSEKPQLPPRPETFPRKKPALPPKPDFLLKEASSCPVGFKKGQQEKVASPTSKSPPKTEKNKVPVPQIRPSSETEEWQQSVDRQHSPDCSAFRSPVAAAVKEISSEKRTMKDTVKTPLQVAEEKYRAKKREENKGEVTGFQSTTEISTNALIGCEGGTFHPTEEIQDLQSQRLIGSHQQENGCALPIRQDYPLTHECQMGLSILEGQKKPYLSAKCHANILRKGTVTTHSSSSKAEHVGVPGTSSSKLNHRPDSRTQDELSEASSLQLKQGKEEHQFVRSKELEAPEMKSEKEKPVVVMREKPCRETEDERRKRLSVHKEEIMKGNVKEAMEIFQNLRRQEELQEILTRVKEFEEETSTVDVKALRNLFENVPEWVVNCKSHPVKQPKVEKAEQMKDVKEDADSVSSVELAFEDLERASAEIIHLKEQTLSRLLDIEEAIKKALYSISSLKSESDIAGLSGLLKESLGNSQSLAAGNKVRQISIVSSKTKQERGVQSLSWEEEKAMERHEMPRMELEVPCIVQPRASSPSSPSYISIQSAARKMAESPKLVHASSSDFSERAAEKDTFSQDIFNSLPRKSVRSDGCNLTSCDDQQEHIQIKKGANFIKQQHLSSLEHLQQHASNNSDKGEATQSLTQGLASDYMSKTPPGILSPSNPRRQKSILELQTSHDGSKLYGATRTVTEQYEEVDEFGNKIITSSTTVTKQSDTQTSTTCDMVSCPTRYEVTASPILRRYLNSPAEGFHSNGDHQETGVVFVTFSNSKPAKKQ